MMSTFHDKCGIATYTGYLTNALTEIGVDNFVYAEEHDPVNKFPQFTADYGFVWNRQKPFNNVIHGRYHDILHIQHQFGLFPFTTYNEELLTETTCPIVTTMHDVVPPGYQTLDYMKPWFKHSDAVIVHTKACLDLAKQWSGEDNKIHLIPHGTLITEIPDKKTTRAELDVPEDAKVILSWGFIWESKGVLDLVKILAEVIKTHPKAMLIHAGGVHPIIQGSTYLHTILKTAVQLGISPKQLRITNWVPEDKVPKWFSVADVIVLNYARGSASASGAAHRALASHRPIVATDDLCLEEIPALKVPRMSTTDMYRAILQVLESTSLQKELVEKEDKAAQEMSWQVVAEQHKKLYDRLS